MISRLDRPRPLPVPPVELIPGPVRGVVADYLRIADLERAAQARLLGLEERRAAAVGADQTAHAAAIRAGRPDPGTKNTDAVDKALVVARREVAAYAEAVAGARADAETAIIDSRPGWQVELDQEDQAARDRYAAAVSELDAARAQTVSVQARREWLEAMPGAKVFRVAEPAVRSLRGVNGDPQAWATILAALRDEIMSDAERRQPALNPAATVGGAT